MNLAEFKKRAREYVEIQAHSKVVSVKFEETFQLFGANHVVLRVQIDDKSDPNWWVIGGASPMNLYSIRVYKTADEAFSLHCGIMLRLSDRDFRESRERPDTIGYDAFISHASEDKDRLVRPLAKELSRRGFHIWYDEFALRVGDSLRRSIDQGLASSRFGIVILSKDFFAKQWPQYELDSLVAKEMDGRKVILPVWYGIDKAEVLSFSPGLADKVAATGTSVVKIANALALALEDESSAAPSRSTTMSGGAAGRGRRRRSA